jgi:hypothetical protein
MKRCENNLEVILELDNNPENEEKLLTVFEMIFAGIEISPLEGEALTASSEESI